MNKDIKTYMKAAITVLVLLFITIGFYSIKYSGPLKTVPVGDIILDILFIFTILTGGYVLLSCLHEKEKKFPALLMPLFIILIIFFIAMMCFYKYEAAWEICKRLVYIEKIIAIISYVAVILGGYWAFKQIQEITKTNKIAAQTNKLSAFSKMTDILQKETGRKKREVVYLLFESRKPLNQWTDAEKKAAHDTLVDIDQIGLMVKHGLLDYEFLEGWAYIIYKCIYILEDYCKEEPLRICYKMDEEVLYRYFGIKELKKRRNKDIVYDYE